MWDERYSQPGFAYGTAPNDFLVSVTPRLRPGCVLSLAEGEGRNAVYLATQGMQVVAVDASAVGLAKAARLAAQCGQRIETVVADLAAFTIAPASWDAIVAIFCHLPPAVRKPLFRSVATGLKPGGHFVLEAYTPRQLALGTGGPNSPELLATLDELREELAGLAFLHAVELEREVIEGRFHTGRAAVVQILAQRT